MTLDLQLHDLPMPRVVGIRLADAYRTLQEIMSSNLLKAGPGGDSEPFKNRKEEMKQRLMRRDERVTFEQATDDDGRQRILLSLYLEHTARSDAPWLPAFDETIANSVLGEDGRDWHPGCRSQATLLFFTHFVQLPALQQLCSRLLESYAVPVSHGSNVFTIWHQQRLTIFATDGPQKVALAGSDGETLAELIDRGS